MAKSAAKAKAKTTATFSFGMQHTLTETVLIAMPIPRPTDWRKELLAELKICFGDIYGGNEWRLDALRKLDDAGRVIWGWSDKFRAKARPMKWSEWDALTKRWLETTCALPDRPDEFDCDSFCAEVSAAVAAKMISLEGEYPFGWKMKQQSAATEASPATGKSPKKAPSRRRRKVGSDEAD